MIKYLLLMLFFVLISSVGMITLIVGTELGMRRLFSDPNIIDLSTSLDEIDFTKYLDFVYIEMSE